MTLTTCRPWEAVLGPEAKQDWHGQDFDAEEVPSVVFRVMSEEHYQASLGQGFHQSDERCNYIGQAKDRPEEWAGQEPEAEGTVAGRWAYVGYLSNSPSGVGRVVRIEVRAEDGWEVHPDDDEGGYYRTFKPISTDRFLAATMIIDAQTWLPVVPA